MRRSTIIWLTIAAALSGCDRGGSPPTDDAPSSHEGEINVMSSDATPTTNPSATAPAATTLPSVSFMTIDGAMRQFPPARVRFRQDEEGRLALLYSAKPRKLRDENVAGNSYYLQMQLDVGPDQSLAGARWQYKAPTSEAVDSPDGIFLDGTDKHIQPFDVLVEFEEESRGQVVVLISGTFLLFDEDAGASPGEFVNVAARLVAAVDE